MHLGQMIWMLSEEPMTVLALVAMVRVVLRDFIAERADHNS